MARRRAAGDARTIDIPSPLPHQLPVLESAAEVKLLRWGRRRGKTQAAGNALIMGHGPLNDADEPLFRGLAQGGQMLWIAKDYPQSAAIWRKYLLRRFAGVVGVEIDKKERIIEIPETGGTLTLRSAESIDNIRGDNFDGIVCDESAFFDLQYALEGVILPALTDTMGWLMLISTPQLGSHFNKLCEEQLDALTGRDPELVERYRGWEQFVGSTRENTKLPKAAVERLYRQYPPGSTDMQQELDAVLITEHGDLFNRSMFLKRYIRADRHGMVAPALMGDEKPVAFKEVLIIVDLATSVKQTADYTVVHVVGVTDIINGARYAAGLDVIRQKLEGPDGITLMADQIAIWKPTRVIIETAGFQLSSVQHLRRKVKGTTIIEFKPKGDKRSRAVSWAALCGRGEYLLPADTRYAPWIEGFIQEHVAFKGDDKGHDDQVDTGSMLAADMFRPRHSAQVTADVDW